MKTANMLLLGAIALTASAAQASPQSRAEFVRHALRGNNSEVAVGRLAMTRGASREVRNFGRMLVNDHGKARTEVLRLARQNGVRPTSAPTPEGAAVRARLMPLRGAAFDQAFAQAMIEDHQKDIADYEAEANRRGDGAVAQYARRQLPALRHHLETARRIAR